MLRIDAPIFYANIERLSLEIQERLGEHRALHEETLQVVALDFSGVNHMDVTGVDGMTEIIDDLREHGIKVYVTTPRREIREVLERGQLGEVVRFVHGNRELRAIGEQLAQDSRTLVA